MTETFFSPDQPLIKNPSVVSEKSKTRQRSNYLIENFDNHKSDMYFSQEIDIEVPLYQESRKSLIISPSRISNNSFNHRNCEIQIQSLSESNPTVDYASMARDELSFPKTNKYVDEIGARKKRSQLKKTPYQSQAQQQQQQDQLKLPLIGLQLNESLLQFEISEDVVEIEDQADLINKKRNKSYSMNRLCKTQRNKKIENDQHGWTWDTSAALIRLMQRSRKTRLIMNTYIWILMIFRAFYFYLLVEQILDNNQILNDKQFDFFWIVFGVYLGIRVMFCAIVGKLLFMKGNLTNDPKIKIVYEIYKQISMNNTKYNSKAMMILVPPELSFIFVATGQSINRSGYYQVQNMILKSLEIFFFVPFLISFLHDKLTLSGFLLFQNTIDFYKITSIVLLIDVTTFVALTIYMLVRNQRKKIWIK